MTTQTPRNARIAELAKSFLQEARTNPALQADIWERARFRGCSDQAAAWDLASEEIEDEENAA